MEHTHYLSGLIKPRSITVIGASENQTSVGGTVLYNLLNGDFRGSIFPVNPSYPELFGRKSYENVDLLPEVPDLALIATPADVTASIVEQCGHKGIQQAVILSAGSDEYLKSERNAGLMAVANQAGVRLLGPNSLGVIRTDIGLNASTGRQMVRRGDLAFVSQSGAICSATIDWAETAGIGFSSIISTGSGKTVETWEILDYLVKDEQTKGILIHFEHMTNTREWISSLRAAASVKPVIAIKSGRYGSCRYIDDTFIPRDNLFNAMLRRTGVVRVHSTTELFSAAKTLTSRYRQSGDRLAIISNGDGPGELAADRALDLGLTLGQIGEDTLKELQERLPHYSRLTNPLYILADADAERYRQTIKLVLADPDIDAVLVIVTPQAMTPLDDIEAVVIELANSSIKPLLSCWMGEASVVKNRANLGIAHIPVFRDPEMAVRGFGYLVQRQKSQQLLLQSPGPEVTTWIPDTVKAHTLIEAARESIQSIIEQSQSEQLLDCYQIPHESQQENYGNSVPRLQLMVRRDPGFGPVIMFGPKSRWKKSVAERFSVALPPLNEELAIDLIENARLEADFSTYMEPLVAVLVHLSEMIVDLPALDSLDLSLTLSEGKVFVSDQMISINHDAPVFNYRHLAIYPYPKHLLTQWQLRDGTTVNVRPIRPADAEIEQQFVRSLSDESRYMRFWSYMSELNRRMLAEFTKVDFNRQMALIVTVDQEENGQTVEREIAVASYVLCQDRTSCEFAVAVADDWQGHGLGYRLMEYLIDEARRWGLKKMDGEVMGHNSGMMAMMKKLGFKSRFDPDDYSIKIVSKEL
ncbi:MAG: GNAT family N-acetyltransferase [Pseudomonadales bacterium]|nr:GNAT family N-acetyltransferase [Pseudomonadales bacterium]